MTAPAPSKESLALVAEASDYFHWDLVDVEREHLAKRIDAHVTERTAAIVDAWNATCMERDALRAAAAALAEAGEVLVDENIIEESDDTVTDWRAALAAYRALLPKGKEIEDPAHQRLLDQGDPGF